MAQEIWVRSIRNTSGEPEQEAKSRKFNVIEAFATMTYCLVVLWLIQYPFGVLMKKEAFNTLSTYLLFAGALYVLFVSPWLHSDSLSSWGVGNPVWVYRTLRGGTPLARMILGTVVLALTIGLASQFYLHWSEAAKFLFRMERQSSAAFKQGLGGNLLVAAMGVAMATFFTTCVIRYDNFLSAFWTALKILAVLATLLYLAALATIGPKAFADFRPIKFALDVFGYLFWGVVQQLLFSSYFGTRIRKGFAPAADPAQIRKKWLCVAVLNGSFFGLIHINSWGLVIFTWVLGIVLSYVFMQDKNRNLVALGFVHGFLGSSVGWLFNSDKAGKAHVSMGVGPSHMHGFDWPTAIVVGLLIAGFTAFMIYAYQKWREE